MSAKRELDDKISSLQEKNKRNRKRAAALGLAVAVVVAVALILPALSITPDAATPESGFFLQSAKLEDAASDEAAPAGSVEGDEAAGGEEAPVDSPDPAQEAPVDSPDPAAQEAQTDSPDPGQEAQDNIDRVPELKLEHKSNGIHAQATVVDAKGVPADAELVVTPITPDFASYEGYMAALNKEFGQDVYTSDNSLLFDVSVMCDGREYEPVDGSVRVTMSFEKKQLSRELGIDEDSEDVLRVIHLPLAEDAKEDASGPASEARAEAPQYVNSEVDPSDVEVSQVDDLEVDLGKTEDISFTLDSLSVITVSGATTNVKVEASLSGTDMTTLDHNLYAYLIPTNGKAYGAKITFANGKASATIPNVPTNTYRLFLVYARDNRELQTSAEQNNVLDRNITNWVDVDGGYIFGYSAKLPPDKTLSAADNTISFELALPQVANAKITASSIMDRAVNYGITASEVAYFVPAYSNFAVKDAWFQNANDATYFGQRASDIKEGEAVPYLFADLETVNGMKVNTASVPAEYYVTDEDKGKVDTGKDSNTATVRNGDEIADRVEIMISNTLKQAETLMAYSMLTLPAGTSMDVSAYPDDATIILDATAICGEQNGYTITKRPGQTIVFNMRGQNVAPPQNIVVKLVDKNAQQVDVNGKPSTKLYRAGDEMRNAGAEEGKVWNKLIWNFPDATSVTATNQIGGVFLVPKGDFNAANKGGGWIVARGKVTVKNEWYGFPGTDTPFVTKRIRKTFVGLDDPANDIDGNYKLRLYTNTNESTSGTTQDKLVTSLVLKSDQDPSLFKDPSGQKDETGYANSGRDAEGNYYYEWDTPFLAIGNEHVLTEENARSTTGMDVDFVEFSGPYSGWVESSQNYEWTIRTSDYESEAEFRGVFNVRARSDDGYGNVYVTNYYKVPTDPKMLSITKTVEDPETLANSDQAYLIEVQLADGSTGAPLSAAEVSYYIGGEGPIAGKLDNGKIAISLKADQTARIVGLPYGTRYTVRETDLPAMCQVSYDGLASDQGASGRLLVDRSVSVKNLFVDDPGVPLLAHKDLIDGVLEGGDFAFRLVDESGKLVKQVTNDAHGVVSFGTLVFDGDGTFDYKLYEVADASKADIVYDPSEYTARIVVEGRRARTVTYIDEQGNESLTTPMFRNRKIPTDADTLMARKVFIDEDTGKAIRLGGGEFSFTATEQVDEGYEGDPLVFTGANDEDGIVAFHDSEGNEFDADSLTRPGTFVIAENGGSYDGSGGQLREGAVISYDASSHPAEVAVDTRTVVSTPFTQARQDNDNTSLTLTFVPKGIQGDKCYLALTRNGQVAIAYSHMRDDGTVSFTVTVNKNIVERNNIWGDYEFEYGSGDNFYWEDGHTKTGSGTITARAGDWGKEPVEISRVRVDGVELAGGSKTEKTVTLSYPEGSYPVFVNTVSTPKSDTADFVFSKVWVDNVSYSDPVVWDTGKEISLKLKGAFKPADGADASAPDGSTAVSEYDFKVRAVAAEEGAQGPSFEFDQPQGADAPNLAVCEMPDAPENHYGFSISGLPSTTGPNGEEGTWVYTLTEEAPAGYAVSYGSWDAEAGKAVPNSQIEHTGTSSGGYLINARVTTALPATGGMGTRVFYAVGGLLVLAALAFLIRRSRK